jgi:hypothetical protein
MTSGWFTRWALFLLLVALALNVLLTKNVVNDPDIDVWSGRLMTAGGVLLLVAALIWVVEKTGITKPTTKCPDCPRRIPKGHVYCHDHLKKRVDAAKERLHGQPGLGI